MKFLILNTDYLEFLRWLYAQHPGLEKAPYEEQHRVRMDSAFGTADFYSSNLRRLGHEAWDVIANIEPMQKQWAREHGLKWESTKWQGRFRFRGGIVPWLYLEPNPKWLYSILAAQVKAYRPDVFYSMAIETIGSDFLRSVRGYYRLAVLQHAAPFPSHDFSEYDLALSSLPNQADYFRQQGMKAELFRLGFEPRILERLSLTDSSFDVVFVGGLGNHHRHGTHVLEQLCRRYKVGVWGYAIGAVPKESPIREVYNGPVWGADMYQVLRNARIVFNRHIDVAEDFANNMRLYEATGVGTLFHDLSPQLRL
jgi:hypothetical protein